MPYQLQRLPEQQYAVAAAEEMPENAAVSSGGEGSELDDGTLLLFLASLLVRCRPVFSNRVSVDGPPFCAHLALTQ
jgi:hypothetical protein